MMSSLKPITIHGHAMGPNPWKVIIILEELGIPYKHEIWDLSAVKKVGHQSCICA